MLPDFASWTAADIALVVLAFAGIAAACLPVAATCLGMSIVRFRPIEEPGESKPVDANPEFDSLHEELTAAGFEPVGAVIEECWLFHHHWYKAFRVHVLRNREKTVYASIYRIVPDEPWRVSLESFMDDGSMVRTVTPGAGFASHSRDYSRREVPQCPLIDLVEQHARHVEEHAGYGRCGVVEVELADRAAIDERLEREQVSRMGGLHNLHWLGLGLALPAYISYVAIRSLAPDLGVPGRYAAAALAGCLVYAIATWWVIPTFISRAAAERNPAT